MTLSLDEVRSVRFPMVRKPNEDGYRASAVDNFMDKLEISYAQLVEENQALRKGQADSSKADFEKERADLIARADQARSQNQALENDKASLKQETARLNNELAQLRSQLDELRQSSDVAQTGGAQLRSENEQLRSENNKLRGDLDGLRNDYNGLRTRFNELNGSAVGAAAADASGVVDGVQRIEVVASADASAAVVRLVELATQQAETLTTDAQREAEQRIQKANGEAERVTSQARAEAERTTTQARNEAESTINKAKNEADTMVNNARSESETLVTNANNESERIGSEARDKAERLLADARGRAERLDGEVNERRSELFTELESERDLLAKRVNGLRSFESQYRSQMTDQIKNYLGSLENETFQPGDHPNINALYGLGKPTVSTPRLDALLAESRLDDQNN